MYVCSRFHNNYDANFNKKTTYTFKLDREPYGKYIDIHIKIKRIMC